MCASNHNQGIAGTKNRRKSPDKNFPNKLAESADPRLRTLVEQLESGELELADSLDKFKRGIELSKQCRAMLDQAQQTIDDVMASDAPPDSADEQSAET